MAVGRRRAASAGSGPRDTAARILDAAEAEFAEHGYAGASTRAVARRAGVPFGALHYHVGTKQALWDAVFRRLGDRVRETVLRHLKPGRSLADVVDNLIDAFFVFFARNRALTRLCCRIFLEPPSGATHTAQRVFDDLLGFGLRLVDERMPDAGFDAALAFHVLANAFVAVAADEGGQQQLLGATIFTSPRARERLAAEMQRVARATLRLESP